MLFRSDLRAALLEDFNTHFVIPEELEDRANDAALKVANKAWKEFKFILRRDFIAKDEEPFDVHKWMNREMWAEFKASRETEEFRAKSEAARALAAKNTHHHRLGSCGYAPNEPKWMDEEEMARLNDQPLPFPNVQSRRARNWLYARRTPGATSSDAQSFASEATREVYSRLVRCRLQYLPLVASITSILHVVTCSSFTGEPVDRILPLRVPQGERYSYPGHRHQGASWSHEGYWGLRHLERWIPR